VKKVDWLYLSLMLTGMTMSDVSWSHSYDYGRNYSGYSYGDRGYSQRHSPRYYSRRPKFSLGINLASSFGSYGRFSYPGRNVGIYGGFAYGQHYPRYRQPYYRPYGYFDNHFYWPAYPPVAYPPVVVVPPDPPVYIQQQPVQPAPPPPPESTVTNYWYYCENPAGYYPEVERCSGEWIKVPPRPAQ